MKLLYEMLPSDKPLSDLALKTFARRLSKYPPDLVESVGDQLLDRCKFAPLLSDFISAIEGDPGEKSLRAWNTAFQTMQDQGPHRSIQFAEPAIHYAIEQMGGWTEFGNWDIEDRPFREKQFRELYNAYRPGTDTVQPMLAGVAAITNGGSRRPCTRVARTMPAWTLPGRRPRNELTLVVGTMEGGLASRAKA